MPDISHDFSKIGYAQNGKPLLCQDGLGRRVEYELRFVSVLASSEHIAKRIQVDWRKQQKERS